MRGLYGCCMHTGRVYTEVALWPSFMVCDSLVPRRLPGIHSSRMRGSLGNLETTVTLVRVAHLVGKVGKPRMALKDEQLMAIQYVYTQGCVCMAIDRYGQYTCMSSYRSGSVFVPRIHLGKAEAAYFHRGVVKLRFYMV